VLVALELVSNCFSRGVKGHAGGRIIPAVLFSGIRPARGTCMAESCSLNSGQRGVKRWGGLPFFQQPGPLLFG